MCENVEFKSIIRENVQLKHRINDLLLDRDRYRKQLDGKCRENEKLFNETKSNEKKLKFRKSDKCNLESRLYHLENVLKTARNAIREMLQQVRVKYLRIFELLTIYIERTIYYNLHPTIIGNNISSCFFFFSVNASSRSFYRNDNEIITLFIFFIFFFFFLTYKIRVCAFWKANNTISDFKDNFDIYNRNT